MHTYDDLHSWEWNQMAACFKEQRQTRPFRAFQDALGRAMLDQGVYRYGWLRPGFSPFRPGPQVPGS